MELPQRAALGPATATGQQLRCPRSELTRPLGIITDRDIVRGLIEGYGTFESLTASAIMASNPFTLDEESGIAEAIEELSARGVRRAPVVSAAGDLVGIVSVDDLLPLVVEELGVLTKLIERQTHPIRQARAAANGPEGSY